MGKWLEWLGTVSAVAEDARGWLLGSIGSIRAKIDVPPPTPAAEEAAAGSDGFAVEPLGTNSAARGSGIPARPKILSPFEAEYSGGGSSSGNSSLFEFELELSFAYVASEFCTA